jgi:hypothetical protein
LESSALATMAQAHAQSFTSVNVKSERLAGHFGASATRNLNDVLE